MSPAKLFDLNGKVAVVTGSSRGIGFAIAQALAAAGSKVVVTGRTLHSCEEAAATIRASGGEAISVPALISNRAQLCSLVDTVMGKWGAIDTLVCNAAVNPAYGSLENVSDEMFQRVMVSNVLSNLWLSRLVATGMRARRDGSIVFISSLAAIKASEVLGLYGITKAADEALCRNLAAEWGPDNVRVNCIAPGLIRTDFSRVLYEDSVRLADREAQILLRRLGVPMDIAGVAVMLAASAGAYITGQTIVVDGGTMIS